MSEPGSGAAPQPQEQQEQQPSVNPNLTEGLDRSTPEEEQKCLVRFINTTPKSVDVLWLDPSGKRVLRAVLTPQSASSFATFKNHPWIFLDSESKERLAIAKGDVRSDVFESTSYLSAAKARYSPEQVLAQSEGRRLICVFIQVPVDRLRSLALQTVRRCVRKKEDCFCLEVPQSMQFELAQMFMF